MPIFLKHIEGSKAGQLDTFDKDQVRIGRQRDNDIAYDPQRETAVSGYHAEIYRDNHNYFIKDLQSRNGTYVNGRKADGTISLKEGDTIQFSSRGPKLSFSLRDPNAVSAAEETPPSENAPTEVFSVPVKDQAAPEKRVGLWNRIQPYLPIIGAVGVSSVLLGVGLFYYQLPWWKLLVGAAILVLFAGAGYLAWRWWRRRKSDAAAKQSEQQDREISIGKGDRGNILDLKKKWGEVLKSLRESKLQRSGEDPIYAFPWYLVIGEPAGGKTSFIRACGPLTSVLTAGADGATRNCDWWFFDKIVLLDTSGRYLAQTKDGDVAGEWQTLLTLLKTNRGREPINGVIIALPADSLVSKPFEKLKEIGAQLRERLDELVQRLAVKFPVYLMVTKSDRINGFNEFFQILPDQVKGQALGYAAADLAGANEAARLVDRAFRVISERLERLRLAVLNDFDSDIQSRGLFLFPAELKSLQSKVSVLTDVLFRPSPYRDAPPLRGLFFTSSRHGGAPLSRLSEMLQTNYASTSPTNVSRDNFVRDFGSVILPTDRQLAGRTSRGRERYRLNRAAGVVVAAAASLLLCGIFTLSFTKNWLALSDLNISRCTRDLDVGTGGGIAKFLRPLDDCRATVETLIPRSFWSKVTYDFGLGFAQKVGHKLQEVFVAEFRIKVANVIDSHIDKSLASDSENAMVVSLIVQRLDRLARCQETGRCDEIIDSDDKFNYYFMLGLVEPSKEGDLSVDRLQRTHESFLSWQTDPRVLREIHAKDLERLRNWSRRGRLTVDWVLKSTKDQFPPVRAAELWGMNARGEVVGSYTARAWKEGISPLISGFQKLASEPEFVAALKKFHDDYRKSAIGEWDSFLTRFPDAESIIDAKGITREFGTKILGADSPYYRAIDAANQNLSVIMGDSWQESKMPPWAIMLKRYVAVKVKPSASGDTSKQTAGEKSQPSNDQAQKYFAMYLDAVSELRTDLGAADKAFKSAQRAFQEGDVSSKASHPLLRATWALNVLKDSIGARQGEDAIFWILLERPLAIAWKAMLGEAGNQLQEQWFKLRLGISKQLEQDPSSVAEKVYGFALEGPAAPFLIQGGRWEPRKIFKQGVEFNEEFLRYLSQLRSSATGLPMTVLDDLPRDIVKPIYSQEK
jgi:type VI secretion system protein ImpL